jgi:RNA polymerase sporulation-specific sigma factor
MEDLLEYENLVYSIISKYGSYFDRDDLYQVGMIGLIDAYKHFDESLGVKFSSYAYYYIVGEVTKFVRENRSVKVSKDIIKLNSSIEKCRDMMRQRLGREPTDMEISLFLEIDEEKISEVNNLMQEVKSLDFCYDEDVSLYNSVMRFDNETRDFVLDLKDAIRNLSSDEKALIDARYYQDMTQSETSKILGMSQVQVSRREGKILEKLKSKVA